VRSIHRAGVALAMTLAVVSASGCAYLRSASAPMTSLAVTHGETRDCLVVLVPGMGDSPEHFLAHDFAGEAHASGLACDFVLPDAHLTYYREQTIAERLDADVLEVARARGYRRIWLVGISLGATGVLETARRRPDLVDGLVLIAPFLGPEDRVAAALDGTLAPPARPHVLVHVGPRTEWLADVAREDRLPLLLAFGCDDRFASGHRRIAGLLDREQVIERAGRHDWRTWRALWTELAARMARLDEERT
jgi:pimeloyl-ACP methyl ester carboxylesterase